MPNLANSRDQPKRRSYSKCIICDRKVGYLNGDLCRDCTRELNVEAMLKCVNGISIETIDEPKSDYIKIRVSDTLSDYKDRAIVSKLRPASRMRTLNMQRGLIEACLRRRTEMGIFVSDSLFKMAKGVGG